MAYYQGNAMRGIFVDLHTHSTASDGTDSPSELVRKAAAAGLAAIALTDHDTLSGLGEAEEEARRCGIRLIRGIEIAVRHADDELHLVGLWMPEPSPRMSEALELFRNNRRLRNLRMLSSLGEMGMPMDLDEVRALSGGGAVGRPHIATAMKIKGYVETRRDAFRRYLGHGGSAFVPRELMSPQEGIALLRDEGAIVVLAHPCLFPHMTRQALDSILGEFKTYGLHAIEAYHSTHSREQVRACVDLAARHGLLLSGGTDYHGLNKRDINIGTGIRGNVRVPLYVLEKMEAYRREHGLPL